VIAEIEGLVRDLVAQNKTDEANELLDQSLAPPLLGQPSSAPLLALRMDLRARQCRWQEAAMDAARALRYQQNNPDRYYLLAALLAKTGDDAAYEEVCKEFFAAFRNITNIFVCDTVAKSCLLLPSSGVDLDVIARLADMAVTQGSGDEGAMPFFQVCKAMAEYRQGHYAEAAEWAQRSIASPRVEPHGQAYAVLAMAKWRMGEQETARVMLAKGNNVAPQVLPAHDAEAPGQAWVAWVFSRIFLEEAAALFESGKSSAKNQ
jgi:Tfp pilus assembly protein PilF